MHSGRLIIEAFYLSDRSFHSANMLWKQNKKTFYWKSFSKTVSCRLCSYISFPAFVIGWQEAVTVFALFYIFDDKSKRHTSKIASNIRASVPCFIIFYGGKQKQLHNDRIHTHHLWLMRITGEYHVNVVQFMTNSIYMRHKMGMHSTRTMMAPCIFLVSFY